MPLFEYECYACDGRFEKLVRSINAEPAEVECPGCGSTDTQKVISSFGVTGAAPRGVDFGNVPVGAGGGHAAHGPG